jgi:Flp pilus assembly pilin Flp
MRCRRRRADWPDMPLPRWFDRIRRCCGREKAQTMAEYAVILGVITPAIVLAYALFANRIGGLFDSVRGIFG